MLFIYFFFKANKWLCANMIRRNADHILNRSSFKNVHRWTISHSTQPHHNNPHQQQWFPHRWIIYYYYCNRTIFNFIPNSKKRKTYHVTWITSAISISSIRIRGLWQPCSLCMHRATTQFNSTGQFLLPSRK